MFENHRPNLLLILTLLAATLVATPIQAQQIRLINQSNPDLLVEQIATGLGVPWGMTFLSANQLLFSERAGRLKLLDLNDLTITRLRGLPSIAIVGQGGMLDVAAGPNYTSQGWIYFTYSKPFESSAVTTLARARLKKNRLVDWQDLLITDSVSDTGRHFGSRIAFDDRGHVFFGIGDRGLRNPAQDLSNHIGCILRLNLDGSIPTDNPFVGDSTARDEIWSYGHRNPQGLIFDSVSKRLWSSEHGPRGGDEINWVRKGLNYGWPIISHGKEYWGPVAIGEGTHKPGMEQPVKIFTPSIAVGSLMLYRGNAFPQWRGHLFIGALKLQHLNRVEISDSGQALAEERLLEDLSERIRALAQDSQGWIYISTDSGKILRLRPNR